MIDADHEIHGGIELPLSLELYYEEKDKQVSKGVFEVEGSKSPKITKNGMCTCKLHITKSSMELDNRRFVLKASAKMKNGSKLEVWSEPLRVMRYRLVIEEGGILEHDEAETRKMKDAAAARFTVSFLRFRGRPDRVDARRRTRPQGGRAGLILSIPAQEVPRGRSGSVLDVRKRLHRMRGGFHP